MPDPLLQEPMREPAAPAQPNRLADAFRASQGAGMAPGYDFNQEPQDDESLGVQFALAIPRGLEGMARGVYGFADFVAFDSFPDWKKRLLGQSTHWGPGLVEGLATYIIPGTVAVKAFGAAQRGAGWAGRLSRLGRSAMAGAVVDAVVTDPYGGRLSDWAKDAGLDNAVTNYLATDPEDSQATARFKNALEGIVPGLALDAVGEAFRAIRGKRVGQVVDPKPIKTAMAALWRDEFGFDHDQHAAVESFIEAAGLDRAKIRPAAELPARAGLDLDPTARAYTLFQEDGTAFIGALKNPDLTSALHELSHVARRQLFDPERAEVAGKIGVSPEDIQTATKWAGAEKGWTKEAEERFAGGFEKYLRDGVAPSKALEGFFSRVATYFRRVYQDLTGTALDLEVTPEMAEVFGRVLSRGERAALTGTTIRAVGKSNGSLIGLVKGQSTKEGTVDLVLYSKDGDLREALPESGALPGPIVPREERFPGSLEDQVEKATADAAFLYRASVPAERVLVVREGVVPDAAMLAKGNYLAWAEEGGAVHLAQAVPVARMGKSTSGAAQVLAVKAPGLNRALAQDVDVLHQGSQRLLYQAAYHGSPHEFDKFNLSKVGTGEGAQAYGHGLYFAENKLVARQYQTGLAALKTSDLTAINMELPQKFRGSLDNANRIIADIQMALNRGDINSAADYIKEFDVAENLVAAYRQAAKVLDARSHLYTVDIPDEATAKMLDWDKPLSEQSEEVKKALQKGGLYDFDADAVGRSGDSVARIAAGEKVKESAPWMPSLKRWQDLTGQDLMEGLGRGADASAKLKELGIPGIKYLDGTSRAEGQGSRNIVVFDDTIVTITDRNGVKLGGQKKADVLYQGARREGDAPQFGNARFDPELPYEPINIDRLGTVAEVRATTREALSKAAIRQRQAQPLSTAHARAIDFLRNNADAQGEAVPHDLIKKLLSKTADQIQEHADTLGGAGEVLSGMGVQLHQKIKAATKGGAATATDADLVDILRFQQYYEAAAEEVRNVQSAIGRALGAQRIRYRGNSFDGKEWIPPRPDTAPEVKPGLDQATPTLLPAGAPDSKPIPPTVEISDPKILPGASTKAIIDAHGGRAKVEKLVNQLDVWMDANPGGIPPAAVRKGAFSMVPEYYINSILSGPITHATNLVSGAINTLVVPLERALGAMTLGRGSQAAAELSEITSHFREAHRAAKLGGLAFKRDQSLLLGGNAGVMEGGQVRAFSAGAQGLDPESLSGRALTAIGKVVNIPSRFLLAEDEIVKQLNYEARFSRRLDEIAQTKFKDAESRADWVEQMLRASGEQGQAYGMETLRRRGAELAAKNGIDPAGREEYIAAYLRTNWDSDAHRAALDAEQVARERTFTEEFGHKRGERGLTHLLTGSSGRDTLASFSGGFANLTNQHPALKLFFPFIRTPTNILEWFLDRSVGAASDGAAFLASSQVRAAYTPEAKAALIGRFATGSALITLAATYASQRDENGLPLLTGAGPQDPDERKAWEATGWRPYSMRVGDKYVSYKRLDPSATFFGIVADLVQERAYSEALNRQPEMGKAVMIALTNNLVSKTYMLGALNLARAIGEPERHAEQMLEGFAGAAAPFSSAVHQAVNPLRGDDVLHEIRGTMEAFKSKWILSDPNKLPVRRNVLGEAMARDKGIGGDPWSPLRYVSVKDDPVAEEMVRIGAAFQPPRETSNGVDWTGYKAESGQNAYDRWMELHGQVKIGGRTMREALERTIQSQSYQRMPSTGVDDLDSPRVAALRRIVSRYRSVAQRQTMGEYPELSSDARKLLVAARMLKTGQQVQATGVQ